MTRPPRPVDEPQVVADYQAGMSLEQLRVRYGVDYYRIRGIITAAGVQIRPVGRPGPLNVRYRRRRLSAAEVAKLRAAVGGTPIDP